MSNSSYGYRGDLYSVQNSPLKRKPAPPAPKKEYKSLVENSRLVLIAKGGKWVIFAIIYPFYLFFGVIPQLIAAHILPKITYFCGKAVTLFKKLTRRADSASRRIRTLFRQLVIQPCIRLSCICKSYKGFKLKIASPAPAIRRFTSNISLNKFSIKPFKFPSFRPITLPKIGWRLPKVKFKITLPDLQLLRKWQAFKKKLTPRINFKFKWPKINIKLPRLPKLKLKTPSVIPKNLQNLVFGKAKAQVLKVFRYKFKMPKISIPYKMPRLSLKWSVPTIKITLPKIDLNRLFSPFNKAFQVLKPLKVKTSGIFLSLFGHLNRRLNQIGRLYRAAANGTSLLLHYWGEQVKEKFDR